jgi:hypothetical protein
LASSGSKRSIDKDYANYMADYNRDILGINHLVPPSLSSALGRTIRLNSDNACKGLLYAYTSNFLLPSQWHSSKPTLKVNVRSGWSSTTRILFTDRSLSLILSTAMLPGLSIVAHSGHHCYSIQSYPDNR